MKTLSNIAKKKATEIFDAENFKVTNVYGNNIIDESDKVIILPYFKELNTILLRYDSIPAYETKRPEIDRFAHVLETTTDEFTIVESIKEALIQKFGLKLSENYKFDILSPIFLYPTSNVRYYICILPLMDYDYEQIIPEELKKLKMQNTNISVNINEINNIVFYELISKYTIDIFKQHYSLF